MEKQSHHAVLSAKDGSFTLLASGQQTVLIIQMAGYEQQELSLKANEQPVNIELKSSIELKSPVQTLNEVVVMGYDDYLWRADVTGSVMAVSSADYNSKCNRGFMWRKNPGFYKTGRNINQYSDSAFITEEYDAITENPFLSAIENPLSTFSIDVDAGSYSNVRRFLQNVQNCPGGRVS